MSRLYLVTYTVEAYVLAEDEDDAALIGEDAVRDVDLGDCADVEEVGPNDALARCWNLASRIYHDGLGDVTLEDAWPQQAPPGPDPRQERLFDDCDDEESEEKP